ncbi:hypothetical protein [Saccharopolyspora dendranthemae]|uniref:DUF2637 domain-containing protein n=1 Tax=Saccharopolyspora dendranthemae TaxID=1181886 RepID=A0A561TX14_9PSEU|nr:hypothetical protein [Saccharopolyspora dendranthemae]TWF91656.1 hypothetical protein FHU35_1879 [Saccharopolyspora dendranthemae]
MSPRQSSATGDGRVPSVPGPAESVEQVRRQVDRLCWSGILLGLAFTMTNVQRFAAAGSPVGSLPWWAAWLLDPMVSLVLLAILRAEQVTARYGVRTGGWVRTAKWFTLAATYVMNTWDAFEAGHTAMVVLHSVPPLVVFVAAEAVTNLRDKLTEAIRAAHEHQADTVADTVPKPVEPDRTSARRISFEEYLQHARESWTPEVTVTPAWIRQVTGCSRGLSSRLSAALASEVGEGEA